MYELLYLLKPKLIDTLNLINSCSHYGTDTHTLNVLYKTMTKPGSLRSILSLQDHNCDFNELWPLAITTCGGFQQPIFSVT